MTPVVFDIGSFSIKAGYSTDEVPQVIRSVVGRSRTSDAEPYIGDSALADGNSVRLSEPISEGMVEDFNDYELLLEFVYSALKADPSEHPVVLGEAPFNSAPRREKIAEIFFEKFSISSLNVTLQGILALVGTGRVTGLVIDCGHGGCHTVPIFESYVIPHGIESMRIGGKDLDILLAKMLALKNIRLGKTSDKEWLRGVKENLCFVRKSSDYHCDQEDVEYTLPDGQSVIFGNELFAVPEAFFCPSLLSREGEGVAALVANSIKNSPIDLTKPLVSNIILSGGSSQFAGFASRLSSEVKYRVSANMSREVKIVAAEDRKISVWNGGKAFAELKDSFQERWMTKNEYDEFGADYIHSKVMSSR